MSAFPERVSATDQNGYVGRKMTSDEEGFSVTFEHLQEC